MSDGGEQAPVMWRKAQHPISQTWSEYPYEYTRIAYIPFYARLKVVVVAVETRGLPSIQACTNIGEDKAARGLHTLNSDYHVHIRLGLYAQPYCLLFHSTSTPS